MEPAEEWDYGRTGARGGLSFFPPLPRADSAEDSVARLLDQLEADADGIRRLVKMADVAVQVRWYGGSYFPDVDLSASTLDRIAALEVALRLAVAVRPPAVPGQVHLSQEGAAPRSPA